MGRKKDITVDLKENDVVNFKVENYTAKNWLISVYFIAFITLVHIVLFITIDFQYTSLLFIPVLAIMGYYLADETLQITAAKEDFPYQVKVTGSKHHFAKEKLNELQMPLHKKGEAFKQEIIALQQTPEWQKPE